jgi:hypothetical protein
MGTLSNLKIAAESSLYRHDGQDLVDKVRNKVQDDSYSVEDILELFNACLVELAGEVLFRELETWQIVETDPNSSTIALPADYHRELRFCHSLTNNRRIHVYGGRPQLDRHFVQRDQSGRVLGVAPLGRQLYYQRIPQTTEQLQINYFRYPEPLRSRDDKPTCLPPHLVEALLVNYAAKELFSEIEDGIEGPQVNTERYTGRYDQARAQLVRFIGPEQRAPVELVDDMCWDDLAYGAGAW